MSQVNVPYRIFINTFLFGVFILTLFLPLTSFAAVQNVWGSAWASTIGWIRFGSSPTETATSYRVTYDPATGALGGYAWSSNIGWVHAAPTSGYPAAPTKGATVNASGKVEGWMRITAIANASASEAGGWNGWIKMSGTNYGVTLNKGTGAFTGFAWSPEIGWIRFDGVSTGGNQPPKQPTLINPIDPTGNKVLYDIPGWEVEPVTPHFEWSAFTDPNPGDAQSAYEIQIQGPGLNMTQRHTGDANTCLYRGFDPCFGGAVHDLLWDTQYTWRVRVFDRLGVDSPWSAPESFRTPKHRRPIADFLLPSQPKANVNLPFIDRSSCYLALEPANPVACNTLPLGGIGVGVQYLWNFGDCVVSSTTCTSTLRDPQHKYTRAGKWPVTLTVTDSDGYISDPARKEIDIGQPLPDWERITPF